MTDAKDEDLRFVSTEGLKPLAPTGVGPWRLATGELLRTARLRKPLETREAAQGVFDAYRLASDAGCATPRPLELVRTDVGYGVIVEFVEGVQLPLHLLFGSYSFEEAAEGVAEQLRLLHGARTRAGRDWNALIRSHARNLARLLPVDLGARLVGFADAIPESDCLLHGDAHLSNFVIAHGVFRLIDMELAGFGDPRIDLAIVQSHTELEKHDELMQALASRFSDEDGKVLFDSFLRSYYEGVSGAELARLRDQVSLIAEVEHCFTGYGFGPVKVKDQLDEGQRERLTYFAARAAELLDSLETVRKKGPVGEYPPVVLKELQLSNLFS